MLPWFIHSFMLPQSVLIDRALSKTKIAENGEFSSTQKQFLSDTVDSIRVVAEWSAKTCNISPYVTDDYNYKMVALGSGRPLNVFGEVVNKQGFETLFLCEDG